MIGAEASHFAFAGGHVLGPSNLVPAIDRRQDLASFRINPVFLQVPRDDRPGNRRLIRVRSLLGFGSGGSASRQQAGSSLRVSFFVASDEVLLFDWRQYRFAIGRGGTSRGRIRLMYLLVLCALWVEGDHRRIGHQLARRFQVVL